MPVKLPSFGLLVLSLAVTTTTACDQTTMVITATGPAPLAANVSFGASFGVEPSTVRPEVLPGTCATYAPFGVRLGVIVRGDDDVFIRSVRFAHQDRFGARALPEVMPIPSLLAPLPTGSTLPSNSPVTVPGMAPLPAAETIRVPGASTVTGLLVPAGSHRRFDFLLRFSCIVVSEGQIVVVIDAADRHGRLESSELRVRMAGH